MLKFNFSSFTAFTLLLLTEISIVIFFKTGFIRHVFGDYLVVLLLYCFLKSFVSISNNTLAGITFLIAFTVEFIQLTPLLKTIGLENHSLANLILGNTFSITDLLAYTLGYITIIIFNSYILCKHFLPNRTK
ncbi:MAG: hypothetical protein COA88_03965 [Kordia sp.]|nr:MAG: hypothetical protein COA88_03965 [Kordia sp.]